MPGMHVCTGACTHTQTHTHKGPVKSYLSSMKVTTGACAWCGMQQHVLWVHPHNARSVAQLCSEWQHILCSFLCWFHRFSKISAL